MMAFHPNRLLAFALFSGLIALPSMASGQTAEPATPPAAEIEEQARPPAGEAAKPTEEELASFATATVGIVRIREAAQQQMQNAVEEAGLTIDEYNRIAQAAQTDPEIGQTLQQLIQDKIGG